MCACMYIYVLIQITSGSMRSWTTKGSVSMSISILSPVVFACSLPSIKMSWKWAAYSGDKVIMEVSATTVAKRSYNLFQTAFRRVVVTSGFPLLLTRSERWRTWVYLCSTAGTMWSPKWPRYLPPNKNSVDVCTYWYIPGYLPPNKNSVSVCTYWYIPVHMVYTCTY